MNEPKPVAKGNLGGNGAKPRKKPRGKKGKREKVFRDINLDKELEGIENLKLKLVIRHLPPTLPQAIFEQSIKQWYTEERISYFKYFPGKVYQNFNKKNTSSRAYIKFNAIEFLIEFYKSYNGHKFIDSKGTESIALVDYALNQKAPKNIREDNKVGTIETDPEYIRFLNKLENNEDEVEDTKANETNQTNSQDEKVTPLIEYLRSKTARFDSRKKNRNKENDGQSGSKNNSNGKEKNGSNKEKAAKKNKEGNKEGGNKERFKGKPNSAKKKSEPFGNKPVQILKAVKPNPIEHEEKPGKPNNISNNGPKLSNTYSNASRPNSTFNNGLKPNNISNNGSKPKESTNNGSKSKEGLKNKGETNTPRKVFLVENGKIAPDGGSSNNNRFKGQRHYRKPENKT